MRLVQSPYARSASTRPLGGFVPGIPSSSINRTISRMVVPIFPSLRVAHILRPACRSPTSPQSAPRQWRIKFRVRPPIRCLAVLERLAYFMAKLPGWRPVKIIRRRLALRPASRAPRPRFARSDIAGFCSRLNSPAHGAAPPINVHPPELVHRREPHHRTTFAHADREILQAVGRCEKRFFAARS